MIIFKNLPNEKPYKIFKEKYELSLEANQQQIEAVSISSYSKKHNEVNSRFVNLKFILNEDFIFFSNYNSSKAKDFSDHKQIAALIYWEKINFQIRIKARIKQTSRQYNLDYFQSRDMKKNALSISSFQSKKIDSYDAVKKNYKNVYESSNLNYCPDYWGGFSFTPYYFEFWQGHESRLNIRDVYEKNKNNWVHKVLEP